MKYITGIEALNLNNELDTCGDWHCSALRWKNIDIRDSEESIYGEWGIEKDTCKIPEHEEEFKKANHLRAILDLLVSGNFPYLSGMREDFICNEKYTNILFDQVVKLKGSNNWEDIKMFMGIEYKMSWIKYLEGVM